MASHVRTGQDRPASTFQLSIVSGVPMLITIVVCVLASCLSFIVSLLLFQRFLDAFQNGETLDACLWWAVLWGSALCCLSACMIMLVFSTIPLVASW